MDAPLAGSALVRLLLGAVVAGAAAWAAALLWWGVGIDLPVVLRPAAALLVLAGLLLGLRVAGSFRVPGWGVLAVAAAQTVGLVGTAWVVSGQRELEGWGQLFAMMAAPFVLVGLWVAGLVVRAMLERRGIDPLP